MEQSGMASGMSGATSGGDASTTGATNGGNAGVADRAREIAGTAQSKLADAGSAVRERAGQVKDSLADALETGADKLRARAGTNTGGAGGMQLAGDGTAAIADDGRVGQVANKVAGGMEATADWLRDADLGSLKAAVEQQAKEHPGRTLLIAVGVGYLLGKALRK